MRIASLTSKTPKWVDIKRSQPGANIAPTSITPLEIANTFRLYSGNPSHSLVGNLAVIEGQVHETVR